MDDIRLVLDAVGSERATVMGVSEGGSLSALFAAMYPERTEKLILFGAFAHTPGLEKLKRLPNFIAGLLKKFMVWKAVKDVQKTWGNGEFVLFWGRVVGALRRPESLILEPLSSTKAFLSQA